MRRFTRFTLCVFLLVILTAGTCAAVTVPGHDGTQLTLGQISDIMRHVTGRVVGDLAFVKESLLVTMLNKSSADTNYHVHLNLLSFDEQGNYRSAGKNDPHTTRSSYCDVLEDDRADYSKRINTLTAPDDDPNGIELAPAVQFSNGGFHVTVWPPTFHHTDANGSPDIFLQDGWGADNLRETLGAKAAPHEIENAMTVKGTDHYVSSVLVRDSADIHVYFAKISGDAYDAVKIPVDYSQTIPTASLPKLSGGKPFFPASIAAGDFDGDGYRNEVALTWSDIDHVYVKVIQLSYNTGSKQYSVKEIYSSTVHDYYYAGRPEGVPRERGSDLDGVCSMYSASVAAGDFDGVSGDEFAVVFMDNTPDADIYTQDQGYADSNSKTRVHFLGMTGKVHVVTHKWNGSTFQTSEKTQNYAYCNSNAYNEAVDYPNRYHVDQCNVVRDYRIPAAVKAVAADVNGDNRDDVVTAVMCFKFTLRIRNDAALNLAANEYCGFDSFNVEALIDAWKYPGGSIDPDPLSSAFTATSASYQGSKAETTRFSSEGGRIIKPAPSPQPVAPEVVYIYTMAGANNRSTYNMTQDMFFKMVTRDGKNKQYYPFFEREYDFVAGKFTGTLGDVVTVDDIVMKHPVMGHDDSLKLDANYVRNAVSLVMNCNGQSPSAHELTDISKPDGTNYISRDYAVGFMKANFLGEGVQLGEPIKITIPVNADYSAILQAMPYHVDNLTADGTKLTTEPQNFTLRQNTSVTYTNSSTSSDKRNLAYSMTKKAETIYALDSDAFRSGVSGVVGISGVVSMILGSSDVGAAFGKVGEIWNKLKDTTDTTTTKSNESATHFTMTITHQANYHDSLYYSQSNRYLWRYPVLTHPAPAWLMGQVKDSMGSFDNSQVKDQQTYITFAMSEPNVPTTGIGINDAHYQPYHEMGNLFSYPADLAQIEGYEGRTYMANNTFQEGNPIEWRGSNFTQSLSFTRLSTSQDRTVKVNKAGPITNFLSMVDNMFGTSLAHLPQDSDTSFTRTVTEQEGLSINIPEAYSGARFYARFEPYIDVAGTMTVGFAVNHFVRDDALWGDNSLYSKKPDPSFILPEKFNHTVKTNSDHDTAIFTSNDNDPTALKARGIRYIVSDYDIESDNLLFKGLKYKIRIPVYNASFVSADNVVVRLSHAKTNAYNAQRTRIGDYTIAHLPGRDGGNHRQFVEFNWTPDLDDGIYYLFADIDPDNKIDEVHENRRNASGVMVDCGGNNMAYFRIGIASSGSPKFDRTRLEASSAGEFLAADSEGYAFPYVHWVKAGGLDLEDFIKQKVDGATQPVPVEVEVEYGGEYLMTEAALVGYKLKPASRGKDIADVTDEDIGLVFVNEDLDIFPGEEHKLHFRINPTYLEDGVGFVLQVHGEEIPLTDIIYGTSGGNAGGNNAGVSSSSGGCESGFGLMAGILALGFAVMKNRR